jgi:hypothetical protein
MRMATLFSTSALSIFPSTGHIELFERLAEVYPTALKAPNRRGYLPLHLAIKSGKDGMARPRQA